MACNFFKASVESWTDKDKKKKVKQSPYRLGQALMVPGG
jgi:hypothetical protein